MTYNMEWREHFAISFPALVHTWEVVTKQHLLTFLWNSFLGCCFACESNRKKVVHPFYDEYLGGREFQEDEVDYGNDFPSPLDVDYIFFYADRDRAFANYLWREGTDHWGWLLGVVSCC